MKLQSLSIALILFSLGQIAFSQETPDDFLPLSESEFTELQTAVQNDDQAGVTAVEKKHAERERQAGRDRREREKREREDRRKPVDPLPDNPIPDQNEGEGEAVSPADPTIDPVKGREERERRRREREERQREQEEYDQLHPKPQKPSFLGWVWSWTLGPILSAIFWPFALILTLIKWGGILALLTIALCMLAFGILCGSISMQLIRWMWNRTAEIIASFNKPKVEPRLYSNDPEPRADQDKP